MRYYAVIDTNVLVSALLNPLSVPGQVAAEAMEGSIIPLYNDEIIAEYNHVLRRMKFKFSEETVRLTVDTMIQRGFFVDAGPVEDVIPDAKDVVFYAVTMEKKKTDDAFLVTGNTKHFPKLPFVVTPREMLDIIRSVAVQGEKSGG